MTPLLSILIVNYNGAKFIAQCLHSIAESNLNYAYEVIVVDNDSKDTSLDVLKTYQNQITLIESKENLGFSKGNNKAAEHAKGSHYLLLNLDLIMN